MRKYAAATVLGLRVPDYPAVWANQVAGLSGWFSRAYGDAPARGSRRGSLVHSVRPPTTGGVSPEPDSGELCGAPVHLR